MRFAFPELLALVALVPVAGLWWTFLRARREKALAKITLNVPKSATSGLQSAAILVGLVLCLFSAARPQWGKASEVTITRSRNVVVAVDVSRSMLAEDVRPNRLERTKADVADLIDSLEGDRCALVAFRRTGVVICPLTTDRGYLRGALEQMTPESAPRGETDLGSAIRASLDALDPAADDHNAIIMISDGGDLRGEALANAALAKKRKVPIFTVGIGDPKRGATIPSEDGRGVQKHEGQVVKVKLEEQALKQIAEASGGRYVPLATAGTAETTLGAIYRRFLRQVAAKEQSEEESRAAERYQVFLIPGICCLLLGAALSKGRFRKTRVIGCLLLMLLTLGSRAAETPCAVPRIILDSSQLDYVKFTQDKTQKLNSGWEQDGNAFVRPFNKVPAGIVRYGAAFAFPSNITASLAFLDAQGGVLKSETITGGSRCVIRGAFDQPGTLASVRLEPSRSIQPARIFASPFRVTVGWAVDENFAYAPKGALPAGWVGRGAKVIGLPYLGCASKDGKKGFDAPRSDAVLEIAPGGFADPNAAGKWLTDAYVFEFDALVHADTDLVAAGVKLRGLYDFTPGIWYHFRFEVKGARARIKLNGREIARDVKVAGLAIENTSKSAALLVDDAKAFALESPVDYPPAPVRPKGEEKWEVLLNVCPLWYNGYHAGWRCIEQGHGPKLVLGYYDEGLPETADWEIKYMVEHGIDVQLFCWYPESHDGPIRQPRNDFHLRDGFKNARYSDRMKYALIWEIENAGRPHSLEAWKKNYVPYLIEHHFKDPRYYTVDGKIVLFVFGGWNFPDATSFGSAETTRAAFDHLGEELKKIGFRGVYPVFSNGDSHAPYVAASGFAAAAPYGYGYDGWKVETQKARNLARAKGSSVFEIPAVSVGFNSEPWHGKPHPMMSPADFVTSLKWIRDEFIPSQTHRTEWEKRAVLLSNWNEYGEGTYLMPTEDARGFGYLDAVRSVFTDEQPDPALNLKPTSAQRARIGNLYPRK